MIFSRGFSGVDCVVGVGVFEKGAGAGVGMGIGAGAGGFTGVVEGAPLPVFKGFVGMFSIYLCFI